LIGTNPWLRRWPQLWNVARGEFAWVGNRPLAQRDAARLGTEFDRLWLTVPIGLVSLADAQGCAESFNDEARAHANFYATQANWRLDLSILARALFAGVLRLHRATEPGWLDQALEWCLADESRLNRT